MNSSEEHVEVYGGDEGIVSADASIPRWLIASYIILPLWGIAIFYYYGNGSYGWLDRGYWQQLQRAALTTFPVEQGTEEQRVREESKPDSVTGETPS